MSDLASRIQEDLKAFTTNALRPSAVTFLKTLGYESERDPSIASLEALIAAAPLESQPILEKLRAQVRELHVLFQLTTEEIRLAGQQTGLFGAAKFDEWNEQSYVFVAMELKTGAYPRGRLAEITRDLNRALGQMPALLLFKHDDPQGRTCMTLAVAQRRQSKRDSTRDVLGKITLVKDISLTDTHRAHLEILSDLTITNLQRDQIISNFDQLERAWSKALDAQEINKSFFRELSNWYFWAVSEAKAKRISLPQDATDDPEPFFIRLITRLMFSWFLLEKNLVPRSLFRTHELKKLLKDFDPESETSGAYYQAILQNLFFATLNTEMGAERRFKKNQKIPGTNIDPEHNIYQLYRYDDAFQDPARALEVFKDVPFLNGGLFECLDKKAVESPTRKDYRMDGFSSVVKKRAVLPNALFFGSERIVDLNAVYDTKNRKYKTRGLIRILESYKFTVAENTPIEEEVALDPELLGQVFENLLATYNPETKSTARKQTGSFYTPRNIVDFMVDESLIAHLRHAMAGGQVQVAGIGLQAPMLTALEEGALLSVAGAPGEPDILEKRLRQLLSYSSGNPFNDTETDRLITAIDGIKILDPACGSGAFPIGALQKLVFVLSKLDPQNTKWQARQLERAREDWKRENNDRLEAIRNDKKLAEQMSESDIRAETLQKLTEREADIRRAFQPRIAYPDYARKLYLIENCIYGVDIQPIAVQIAKLRCFIALVVDQRVVENEPNRGVRPLPNLETKFIAANTLGQVKQSDIAGLFDTEIDALRTQIRTVRREHFETRTHKRKEELRKQDAKLRTSLSALLEKEHSVSNDDAKLLSGWNPYDQNAFASFFDPLWMFNLKTGFDVLIGNPPYVRQEEIKDQKPMFKTLYPDVFTGVADLFVYFFKRSLELLRDDGVLTFICSNKYFRSGYGQKLREVLGNKTRLELLIDFGDAEVFTAIAYPSILVTRKAKPSDQPVRVLTWKPDDALEEFVDVWNDQRFAMPQSSLKPDGWRIERSDVLDLLGKLRAAGTPLGEYVGGRFYRGILTGLNEAFVVDRATRDALIAEHPSSAEIIKPFLRGRDVKRWRVESPDLWLIFTRRGINIKKYPAIKRHLERLKDRLEPGTSEGRKAGSYNWYEIQDNIAYFKEFEESKIIYPDIALDCKFAIDFKKYYVDCTLFLIPESSHYLLGVLNSSAVNWFFKQISPSIQGGFLRFKSIYVSQIPVPKSTSAVEKQIEVFTKSIGNASSQPHAQLEVRFLESIINAIVYELYLPDILHSAGRYPAKVIGEAGVPELTGEHAADLERIRDYVRRLSAPDHAVAQLLYYLDSIPEIRIIEGKTGT